MFVIFIFLLGFLISAAGAFFNVFVSLDNFFELL